MSNNMRLFFFAISICFSGVHSTTALADLHNFDKEGLPSVAHTDLLSSQMVKVGNFWKLNDFNRARFIMQHNQTKETCPYAMSGHYPGSRRSPEEHIKNKTLALPHTFKVCY